MAKSVAARLSEAFEYSAVYIWEKVGDIAEDMSEKDVRDLATFGALEKSVRDVPYELIEQTIQLHARNSDAFESSLTVMCSAVCDTFRPATAAEFIEKLNADIRSEIDTGKSSGGEFARRKRECDAAFAAPVAAEN
jgi:hypothetical protein